MNKVEEALYRRKITLAEVCEQFGIDLEDAETPNLDYCSNCSIWFKVSDLIPDLDNNPICKVCNQFYGM